MPKNTKTQILLLEKELKSLECSANYLDNFEYISCKSKLDQFYEEKENDIGIRSKCDWYKYGEKSTKFFLNLEKTRAHQNKIRNILINRNEITDQKEVNNELFPFYNNLFKNDKRRSRYDTTQFLSSIQVPCLTVEQSAKCEFLISEEQLICALKNMSKNKSPGNDGLTKEFYEIFWDELKIPFIASLRKSFLKEEISNSRKQAVIRLIEKKDNDKRYIQNWRPLSLLNTDVKILSKALAQFLKTRLFLF